MALAEHATEREQQHAKAYLLMVTGKGQDALALTHEHMQRWPRDAFLLAPSCGVFGLIGFSGRKGREPEQLELLAPLAKHYGDDWWFLSAHAFALLETWYRWQEVLKLANLIVLRRPGEFPIMSEQMTAYKVPKHIEFRDELPKTNVGKILRRALREA